MKKRNKTGDKPLIVFGRGMPTDFETWHRVLSKMGSKRIDDTRKRVKSTKTPRGAFKSHFYEGVRWSCFFSLLLFVLWLIFTMIAAYYGTEFVIVFICGIVVLECLIILAKG